MSKFIKIAYILIPAIIVMLVPSVPGFLLFAYFIYLILLLLLHTELVHGLRFFKARFSFEIEILIIFIILLTVIAMLDFSVVETFKKISNFPYDSSYWYNLFNILIPLICAAVGTAYYLGKRSIGDGIKIFLAGLYMGYSALNDYLYYLLNSAGLPDKWTWLATPRFLFGVDITTNQLIVWTVIMMSMALIILSLPLDQFIRYRPYSKNSLSNISKIDGNSSAARQRHRNTLYNAIVAILFIAMTGLAVYFYQNPLV